MLLAVSLLLFSLVPLLVQGCSCPPNYFPNRTASLEKATRNNANVYSGVVVGAICTCISGERTLDCRNYTYSEEDDSYSLHIQARVQVQNDPSLDLYLRNCSRAEANLDVGDRLIRGPEPSTTSGAQVCSFSSFEVCAYTVRVTEVFTGSYNVGDLITSPGPDVASTCAAELGRILQLKQEYLVGVGGPCVAFGEWQPLSQYMAEDLRYLRVLGGKIENKPNDKNDTESEGGRNNTMVESSGSAGTPVYPVIAILILLGFLLAT